MERQEQRHDCHEEQASREEQAEAQLRRRARLKVLLAVLSATGFIFPFKIASSDGHAKGAALGLLLGVCLLLGIPALVRHSHAAPETRRRTLQLGWRLALAAAVGNIAQGFAFEELHAGVATVLLQTNFLFVAVLGAIWLKEKLSASLIFGLCLTMLGVVVTRWGELTAQDVQMGWGVAWAIGSAMCFSMMDLVSRRHASGTDSLVANAHRALAAGVLLIFVPGALADLVTMGPNGWAACLAAAALGPGLARNLLMSAAKELPAVESALLQQLRPILALPLASAYFGHWPSLGEWLGCAMILLGVALPMRFR